jgi:CHAT domain-containing protein
MEGKEIAIRVYSNLESVELLGDSSGEAITLNDIGVAYSYLVDSQKTVDYYTQALPIATTISDPLLEALVFHNLERAQRGAHPSLAIFYGKKSVNLLQKVRGNMKGLSKDLQRSFMATRSSYYHDLTDLLISQDRLPEAQQVLDMMKTAQFDEFTRGSNRTADGAGSLTAREQAAENAYQTASQHLFEIADAESELEKRQNPTAEEKTKLAGLQQQLTDTRRAFTTPTGALPGMLPDKGQGKKAEAMNDKIPELQDLMGNIAEPGTVALYTMITDNYYRVIVIRNDGRTIERHSQIPIATLRQEVARFKELLGMRPGASATDDEGNARRTPAQAAEMMDLAAKLYNLIMTPIAGDLAEGHAHTLVWELDDVLHYIPLGALYDPAKKQFQVQQYANVITTPKDQQKKHELPDLAGVRVLALGLSRSGYDQEFGSLPNVPNELAAIVRDPANSSTHGVLPGSEWLDLRFTEARLINELSGSGGVQNSAPYKIVHIASHFNADPAGDYIKLFLLLAGQNDALDQKGQGFHLTLDDLKNEENLRLIFKNVDLLTLSACQTAVAVQNGDGREIDGLGGVAQEQGADAVMASLWSVDDQSTATLMKDFYKLWTDPAAKLSKAEALRETQAKMIGTGNADAPYSDPYYWAPFILMGNWK